MTIKLLRCLCVAILAVAVAALLINLAGPLPSGVIMMMLGFVILLSPIFVVRIKPRNR